MRGEGGGGRKKKGRALLARTHTHAHARTDVGELKDDLARLSEASDAKQFIEVAHAAAKKHDKEINRVRGAHTHTESELCKLRGGRHVL